MKYILAALFTSVLLLPSHYGHSQITIGGDPEVSYSSPRTYELAGITVSGTEMLDPGAIKLLSGFSIGETIEVPGDKTADAIKKLWAQDLFSDVQLLVDRVDGNKIFLEIRVKERSRLSRFRFTGVKKSEADDLREKINLFKEKIVTENLIISTEAKVRKYFVDKGFWNVAVNIESENDSLFKERIIMTIHVNKGNKIKIRDIDIQGNRAFSEQWVLRGMKETKEKSVFQPFRHTDTLAVFVANNLFPAPEKIPVGFMAYAQEHVRLRIFKSSKFNKGNFNDDKDAIVLRYNKKGYRDAKIVSDSVYPSGPKTIDIDLVVNEGHRYYFRNIEWIGNTKYKSEFLSSVLGIKKGDVYDPVKLEARLYMDPNGGDVSSLYMDNGYLFFQLEPVEILAGNDSIDLEIRMYEGEQARINRVTVTGNTKTNDHVIMREIRTKPGELFSRADIIRSQRELSVLGFFDPEKMNVLPKPNPANGTVDIEYVVEEKPSDQLNLSGGYGGGLFVGTLGVTFTNFSTRTILRPREWNGPLPSGDGQRLNLQAQASGRAYQAINFSFTEPWLGGRKPNSLTVSAFYSIFHNTSQERFWRRKVTDPETGKKIDNPDRSFFEQEGLSVGLGKRLKWPDDYFLVYFEGSAQRYRLQNYFNTFAFATGRAYNLYGKVRVSRSSIDQAIFPTMGSELSFTAQFTPPYSSIDKLFTGNSKDYSSMEPAQKFKFLEYQKFKFTAAYYTKLVHKFVLYSKVGFGALGMYNRNIGLVPFERFYLGGSGLTNFGGYDSREFIALRGYDEQDVSPTTGASLINKYTLEIRYPFSLNPSATIYGLAFAEAGNSWANFGSFNPLQVYRSAGLGVRIYLPMFGLLGLDFAHGFDQEDIQGRPGFSQPTIKNIFTHFTLGFNLGEL